MILLILQVPEVLGIRISDWGLRVEGFWAEALCLTHNLNSVGFYFEPV